MQSTVEPRVPHCRHCCLPFSRALLADLAMNVVPILAFAIAVASPPTAPAAVPSPISEAHMADLGCVALLGLVADMQRRAVPSAADYPDVRETGKRWAGIVGQRVMDETGQPRELVAMAIQQAVTDWQGEMQRTADTRALVSRVDQCHRRMAAELAVNPILPKPETAK